MRFIFFTKTEWDEPPRLRHQLADLLRNEGHEVHFFQKCKILSRRETKRVNETLTLLRHPHLLHHQLKFIFPIRWLDETYLKYQIRSLAEVDYGDVIVNFNYDFYFLSELFLENPIIHVVNDDFPAAAIPPNRKTATNLQARTARDADHSLCVSYLIADNIRKAGADAALFFPWARHRYERPAPSNQRNELLYWGYINERIDERIIMHIMNSGIRVNFAGAITPSATTDRILGHTNATWHGVGSLDAFSAIRSKCSAAIAPYDLTNPYNRAITVSNRAFELLSFGFPLLFNDLPHLIEAPARVIYRCSTGDEFIAAFNDTTENFDELQSGIEEFLQGHYAENRYTQFMDIVEAASMKRKA